MRKRFQYWSFPVFTERRQVLSPTQRTKWTGKWTSSLYPP